MDNAVFGAAKLSQIGTKEKTTDTGKGATINCFWD